MQKQCLKCGHVNPQASGGELEACPACGAIYSRVEAAATAGRVLRPAPAAAPAAAGEERVAAPPPASPAPERAAPGGRPAPRAGAYIEALRAASNYPTFRQVVGLFAFIGYALAALAAVVTAVLAFKGSVMTLIGGALGVIWLVIVTRVGKELALMMADAADAMVRAAERLEERV